MGQTKPELYIRHSSFFAGPSRLYFLLSPLLISL
jgi:hypothetical protein